MSDLDPLDVKAQERAQADWEVRQRFTSYQKAEDFKWLMSDRRGRRFVWRLLEETGLFQSSFTGNSETFFREGQRNVGLRLMAMINEHCPDRYNQMVTEQKTHDHRNAESGRDTKHGNRTTAKRY